jgi:hypothetical protein
VWFTAGAGVGVYTVLRTRRIAEAFTPEGLADRLAGLAVGARLFRDEVRTGAAEAETGVRDRLGLAAPPRSPQLTATPAPHDPTATREATH